jgi:hypothetical protein
MNFLNRALRELVVARQSLLGRMKGENSPELIPFVINLRADTVPTWIRPEVVEVAVREAVTDAVARLARGQATPGQLLARKNVPAELRSQAARSMLAMRGGRATAAKMRPLGYPNLIKAREALRHKAKG